MQRRDFIRLSLGTLGVCTYGIANEFSFRETQGCCLAKGDLDKTNLTKKVESLSLENPIISVSGDHAFDKALGRQLVKLAKLFEVYPGFGYMNETGSKNANASRESRIYGTNGTVLFGLKLLHETLGMGQGGDIAVLGICAHEFAHIFQFFSPGGYEKTLRSIHPTVKLLELHADYMSGYFIGYLKQERPQIYLQTLGKLFYSLGDMEFGDPNHHGTPEERVRAIETGYKTAWSVNSAVEAAKQGVNFVSASFPN